jgi:hypothetical protein
VVFALDLMLVPYETHLLGLWIASL